MNEQERESALKVLPGWDYKADKKSLQKEFTFKSYLKTISFVNAVAWLANKENHHPDMIVTFSKCVVELTTHDEGGISEKDFKLAGKIDELNS